MVRVLLEESDYCDVAADALTFDEGVIVFWKDGDEVARQRQNRIQGLEMLSSPGRRVGEARKTFPNAYKPWTTEQEQVLTEMFKEGSTMADLTSLLGRQPGGIESRLRHLGLLGDNEHLG
ncbi:hypothetical protein [Kribbella deserti]|uniref:Uncharacterized protein n=1 Tax=Kribbella deserti TaxID=1926257 RepID=A0ABV6QTQ2_9ACTN